MGPSIWQLLIVLLIVLLLFGAKRLRNVGGDLGAAIKGFRSAVKDGDKDQKTEQITEKSEGTVIEGEATTESPAKEKDQA